MRILLVSTAFNGLTQRYYTELQTAGYQVSVELHNGSDEHLLEGVRLFEPELIICPFLTRKIPEEIYKEFTCIIVHPGIKGDRGPSSLDWAIQNNLKEWGVTLLQADDEMDAGDIWCSKTFPLRQAPKSSIYNREVTQAAVDCLWEFLTYFELGSYKPEPLDYTRPDIKGTLQPLMKQSDRAIDWESDTTDEILRRIYASDGVPGVKDEILGQEVHLFNASREENLTGIPGEIIATADHAICRATVDGAIWIGHLRSVLPDGSKWIKLPATQVLGELIPDSVPSLEINYTQKGKTLPCQEVWYEIEGDVAYLYFKVHNGAMNTEQCRKIYDVYRHVNGLQVKTIVLMGGEDYWSNGIHLNAIEAAENSADESWNNINAINDLAYQILVTGDKLTVSAISGNSGAGGVMLALAADFVVARSGVVMNPHYKNMGGLYGSEYWTYSLPRRVGQEKAEELTQQCLPLNANQALRIGMIDKIFDHNHELFYRQVQNFANSLSSNDANFHKMLDKKSKRRAIDESRKLLAQYRKQELKNMYINFFEREEYHTARHNFVFKISCQQTPTNIAVHRSGLVAT